MRRSSRALTGEWATDPLDRERLWRVRSGRGARGSPLLCAAAGLDPARLPRLAAHRRSWVRSMPLPDSLAGVPLATGAGDALAGVLGSAVARLRRGILAAMSGTSTSLVVSTDRPALRSRLPLPAHAPCPAGCLGTGNGSAGYRLLAALAGRCCSISHQAICLIARHPHHRARMAWWLCPTWLGEQGALWDPQRSAAFIGFFLTRPAADLARVLLEGMAFETRRCLDIWQEAGCGVKDVVLSGGLDNAILAQLLANVLDLPVRVPHRIPASAYGAALLAGIGAGAWTAAEG